MHVCLQPAGRHGGEPVRVFWSAGGRFRGDFCISSSGLRGGSFSYLPSTVGYDFDLQGVRWTQDVAVSGLVSWDQTTNLISAQVTLRNAGRALGALSISWNDADINAVATVTGTVDGAALKARRIAP